MIVDPKQVIQRNAELKAMRATVETQYRDIARLMRPEQSDMFDGNSKTNVYDDIYDATAISALESFSGGLFTQMTNPTTRWVECGLEDEDLAKFGPVKRWLWQVGNVIYASLAPGVSQFYQEASAWYSDLGAFGIGTIYQEEVVGKGRFIDRCIPLGETLIDLDANGEIDTFHRNFRLKGAKAKVKFPELQAWGSRCGDGTDYEFIHAVMPNPDYVEGRLGIAGMPWLSLYCCQALTGFQRLGGYREMPYATVMWNRRPGRIYPVGPGHVALPDVMMLNEMERTHLVAAQFAAEPPILLQDEATVAAADIHPNALLYGQVTDRGQPLAQPLNRAQNLQLSLDMSNARRDAVREAFFFNVMQLMKRPQMTATEFLGFSEEALKLMGPNLARIQGQGLSPHLSRRFNLLLRAGAFPEPPDELDGQVLKFVYVSPLAKLQKSSQARAVLSWVNGVGQIAAATTDAGVLDTIDGDASAQVLHEAMGPPPSVLRDPAKIAEIRKQRAQIMAQREQLANEAQSTETAAVAAHAVQAQTLSDQRGAGR